MYWKNSGKLALTPTDQPTADSEEFMEVLM